MLICQINELTPGQTADGGGLSSLLKLKDGSAPLPDMEHGVPYPAEPWIIQNLRSRLTLITALFLISHESSLRIE